MFLWQFSFLVWSTTNVGGNAGGGGGKQTPTPPRVHISFQHVNIIECVPHIPHIEIFGLQWEYKKQQIHLNVENQFLTMNTNQK